MYLIVWMQSCIEVADIAGSRLDDGAVRAFGTTDYSRCIGDVESSTGGVSTAAEVGGVTVAAL